MRGFRAWHTKLNRYLKDDEFFIDANGKVCTDSFRGSNYEETFDTSDFDSGYIILEQDTGLKDKNGKKIHEGDIIQCHLSPISSTIFTGVVEFRPGCIMFKNFADSGAYAFNSLGAIEAVIGNIHENPELLEEEQK